MRRLKAALEDRVGLDSTTRQASLKKQDDQLRQSRAREAQVMAVAQKVASRLDKTIDHVENVLRR